MIFISFQDFDSVHFSSVGHFFFHSNKKGGTDHLGFCTDDVVVVGRHGPGAHGGGGPVHRPGRRQEAAEAARDHFGREAGQAQQRQDARPQDRERQQKSGLPAHQGEPTLAH